MLHSIPTIQPQNSMQGPIGIIIFVSFLFNSRNRPPNRTPENVSKTISEGKLTSSFEIIDEFINK